MLREQDKAPSLRESGRVIERKKSRSLTLWECAGVKHVVFLARLKVNLLAG